LSKARASTHFPRVSYALARPVVSAERDIAKAIKGVADGERTAFARRARTGANSALRSWTTESARKSVPVFIA
jgi:hypothetical protein